MNRRQVLKSVAGLTALAAVKTAAAEEFIDFTPELYAELLETGKPFMLGFLSDW